MATITEIKGREVFKVRAIATDKEYDVAETSPMFKQKYRRFSYGGKVFIANTADEFCEFFAKKKIYSIDLDSNEEGLVSMVGFTTIDQEVSMAQTEVMLASFTVDNFMAGKLNPEATIAGIE